MLVTVQTAIVAAKIFINLAGEGIHGSINFRLNDETLINSIKLRALGKAVVHWYFLNQYSTLIFINNCDQGRN